MSPFSDIAARKLSPVSDAGAAVFTNVMGGITTLMADPLKYGQELMIVLLAIIILSLLFVYWNRFVYLITGDDRIHCNPILDPIWACCRCCGWCNGEWTRYVSECCCWCDFLCCSRRLRGRNLVNHFGRLIGWSSISVEIKNITVGDLPFDGGRGDFYLSIEAQENPPMVTALQEEKLPKLVHFPEIISLKIRDSPLEYRVRIVVKELNVVGSEEICEVHLSAASVIAWAQDDIKHPDDRVKRFQMRPMNNSIERETPAWILLEFAESDDVRNVDAIRLPMFPTDEFEIRTWVPRNHPSVQAAGLTPMTYDPNNPGDHAVAGNAMWTKNTRMNVDLKVSPFKHHYHLVDDAGNPVAEPDEENLRFLHYLRKCLNLLFKLYQFLVVLAVLAYSAFRFYVWSCYRHFEYDTMALLRGAQFPISDTNLDIYVEDCHKRYRGTGLSRSDVAGDGKPTTNGVDPMADACRPNASTIVYYCENLPPAQPRPEAFTMLARKKFGLHLDHGVKCFHGVCRLRNDLVEWDTIALWTGVGLLFSICLIKHCINSCIRSIRKGYQKADATAQKNYLDSKKKGTNKR